MRASVTRPAGDGMPLPAFDELDRVKLKRSLSVKGVSLASGKVGTVVYCHGAKAYEIEFSGIRDVFQIEANDLEKV